MASTFEFRLFETSAPDGELDVDDLLAIANSLKEIATRIGRVETDAESRGRPPGRTRRVARLTIGLAPGSTRVLARRSAAHESLPFDLDDERSFDEQFREIVEALVDGERPSWVSPSLATAVDGLRSALARSAKSVDFGVDGKVVRTFRPKEVDKGVWAGAPPTQGLVEFIGRLRAVNLDTRHLHVTDDAGNRVGLIGVPSGPEVGALLDGYVQARGVPETDHKGRIVRLRDAEIAPAPQSPVRRKPVPLEVVLASAPGPEPGGIEDLSDEEIDSFLRSIGA